MKTSTILLGAAGLAAAGFLAYRAFASSSATEDRLKRLPQIMNKPNADIKPVLDEWAKLTASDKSIFDRFVSAMDAASTAAQMKTAEDRLVADIKASEADHHYANADKSDPRDVVGLVVLLSYGPKLQSVGLPTH